MRPKALAVPTFPAALVFAASLWATPIMAQPNCPPGVDITTAFARGDEVLAYIGIDIDADTAHYCDGSGTQWPAKYAATTEGFTFEMLARNGFWPRTMRPIDGKVADTWAARGQRFSLTVVD